MVKIIMEVFWWDCLFVLVGVDIGVSVVVLYFIFFYGV